MKRSRPLVYGLSALLVLVDQLTKQWATANLVPLRPEPLLPGLLELQLTHNSGAAFSLFAGSTKALAVISLAVALGVVIWFERHGSISLPRQLGLALVLGGAIGNGLDRWRAGAVVDFLALVPIQFPIFNGADLAINLAVLLFAIDLLGNHGKSNP